MAAADYVDQIQNLYIAYFGRPADPAGLAYWTSQVDAANGNLSAAIAGFATSAESGVLYAGVSLADKVTAIYQNLFNRAPEVSGLNYWVAKIASGEISDAQAAYQILAAAGPGDAGAIANKLSVAKAFTAALDTPAEIAGYSGSTSAASARSFLAKVDSTTYTLNQAATVLTNGVAEATGTQTSTTPAPAPTPAAFTATVDSTTHAVTFGGTATGDITLSRTNDDVTFSRDGNKASAVTFGGVGATSIALASGQTLVLAEADANNLSNYIPNGGSLSISGTGTVKLTDSLLHANMIRIIDDTVAPKLDLTSATRLTGTVADINTVTAANGLTLDVANTLNLTVSDTSAHFSSGKINATGSHDALTVTDASASALSLANFTGFETITLNGSTGLITVADGKGTTVISNTATKVQLGSGGQTFSSSVAGNEVAGGSGNDTFSLSSTTGSNTITSLASGDVLKVASGSSVEASTATGFTATDGTVNDGSVTITNTALNGGALDVSLATGSGGFKLVGGSGNDTLTGSVNADVFTGGAGNNIFKFAASQFKATDVASLISTADTIEDWGTFGNKIDFDVAITRVEHNDPAVAGKALIQAGYATFNAADNTLALKLAAVVSAVNTDAVGTAVSFREGADSYLFVVGNAAAGIQEGDALIKLTGVQTEGVFTNSGDITLLVAPG